MRIKPGGFTGKLKPPVDSGSSLLEPSLAVAASAAQASAARQELAAAREELMYVNAFTARLQERHEACQRNLLALRQDRFATDMQVDEAIYILRHVDDQAVGWMQVPATDSTQVRQLHNAIVDAIRILEGHDSDSDDDSDSD